MTPFIATRRVEFCDTDMAGIVHFSNFNRYMEAAEHAWFRSLELKISGQLPDGTPYGWPRVSASCSFRAPARYNDIIEIHVKPQEKTSRSLTARYDFFLNGKLIAEGEMKTVFCLFPADGPMRSAAMPEDISLALDSAMPAAAADFPTGQNQKTD